jgi:hypothetical protein
MVASRCHVEHWWVDVGRWVKQVELGHEY